MGIRIQPREIDVPKNDPFKNNLLGRKESVEVLIHLIGNLEGPCVLAVDAAWGTGFERCMWIYQANCRRTRYVLPKPQSLNSNSLRRHQFGFRGRKCSARRARSINRVA